MNPIKNLAKRLLRALGYELLRVRADSPAEEATSPVDPAEMEALHRDLRAFFETHGQPGSWVNLENIADYLGAERVHFYHQVVKLCRREAGDLAGRRVADMGTGTGYLLRVLAAECPAAKLYGFEIKAEFIPLAEHLCPTARISWGDVCEAATERFGVVLATEVLEHLVDPRQALQNLTGYLEPDGILIVTVPDGRRDTFEAGKLLEHGRAHTGHINFWSPESWALFLAAECGGWRVETGTIGGTSLYAVVRKEVARL